MSDLDKAKTFEIQANVWIKILTRIWLVSVSSYFLFFSEVGDNPLLVELVERFLR